MEIKAGVQLSNRYHLRERVGDDRFSETWLADDTLLQRKVAVRCGPDHGEDEEIAKRTILGDARIAANFVHPNILPIYDYGIEDDLAYSVEPFIESGNLKDFIYDPAETTAGSILALFKQLASAIDYLHQQGIIHRDIQPDNVLLDHNFHPYLIDFSYSTLAYADAGDPDTVLYCAPEILNGQPGSPQQDIYSFGIMLYECLTEHNPFEGLDDAQIIAKKQEGHLPSVREHRKQLTVGIDVVLQKLTHIDPQKRYITASHAVDDLYKVFYSGRGNIDGKIFISYARGDKDYVHSLASELRRIGLDIWIDRDIEAGSDWDEAIENALDDCDMMLLITTESSMASDYVMHEWSYVMGSKKPVYPFIPKAPVPKNIHARLTRVQYIVGTDDMLDNIARIVAMLSGNTSPGNEKLEQ